MTYVIQVLEPGKKNRKMYAGGGQLTTKWIHAKQYRDRADAEKLVDDMNKLNLDLGFVFSLKEISGTGHDMYATPVEKAQIDNKLKAAIYGD